MKKSIFLFLLLVLLSVVVPGLGFLLRRQYKYFAVTFIGFVLCLFVAPFIVGHENQAAVPWIYSFYMLGSGLFFWESGSQFEPIS